MKQGAAAKYQSFKKNWTRQRARLKPHGERWLSKPSSLRLKWRRRTDFPTRKRKRPISAKSFRMTLPRRRKNKPLIKMRFALPVEETTIFHGEVSSLRKIGLGGGVSQNNSEQVKKLTEANKRLDDINTQLKDLNTKLELHLKCPSIPIAPRRASSAFRRSRRTRSLSSPIACSKRL